jgi:ABC-type Fe3+/spermidine/putrescine transport system ATPase subunit
MLSIENISKKLGAFLLSSISLSVNRGEYFIILGPSGAGKSILLEIIAGLVQPDDGKLTLNSKDITTSPIQLRNIGLVFQDFAIFPHLNVRNNIAYPLKGKGLSGSALNREVLSLAKKFGVSHLLKQNASTLSGGEQQRVALARTLALKPDVLLLDEPLSALDSERRVELRSLLRGLNRDGQTIIHVTHDYEEAIALGHRVAIMSGGKLEQVGTPEQIFNKPASTFIANLVGVKNFFLASLTESNEVNLMKAHLASGLIFYVYADACGSGYITFPDNSVTLSLTPPQSSALNSFSGEIVDMYPQRYGYEIVVNIKVKIFVNVTHESVLKLNLKIGSRVWISLKASNIQFIRVD